MKNILTFFLIFIAITSFSQDQLFKKDNTKIDVKILEINQSEIKYKLFTYQEGPTIVVSKSEVALIIYQNGVHEVILSNNEPNTSSTLPNLPPKDENSQKNSEGIKKHDINDILSKKNLISFNALETINGSIGFSYIREFADHFLHAYVPISLGFASPFLTQLTNSTFSGGQSSNYYTQTGITVSDYYYSSKNYEVGLGLHLQTSGKSKVTHFIGPYVGTAQFVGTYDEIKQENNNYITTTRGFEMNRLYVMLNNGLLIRPSRNFNIMLLAGFGYHTDTYKTNNPAVANNYNKSQFPFNSFKFGLNFGYRF